MSGKFSGGEWSLGRRVRELAGAIPVAISMAESWGAIPVAISMAESWGAIPVAISMAESWV